MKLAKQVNVGALLPITRNILQTIVASLLVVLASVSSAAEKLDRTVLPIREPKPARVTELDARNAKAPPRFEIKAPAKAPNVLIVLIDDMGYGQASAFGGPIHMPTLEKLASSGLRYNQFHTTALCSLTRIALLTGRNNHVNNMGWFLGMSHNIVIAMA